eukprot:CAMPEP_0119039240 /NCGR_PEP_ID=MMETSP1177-20130426/8642_1 /TAXON_ID=2985 /ORGANISM="Ochromonas sp, Strain CCMP1899" /LENGTH=627 /DNA_ID=CAMNT_0007002893 /DNA_START=377 /DNA_END=2260 /DNA_ORIENTATION=+
MHWLNNQETSFDAVIQARLFGTTIVAANVDPSNSTNGVYTVEYTLEDSGTYHLQIRVAWLTGTSIDHSYTPRYAHDFLNKSIYTDCIFYNQSISVVGNERVDLRDRKELCKGGDQPGRWIKLNTTTEKNNVTPCVSWACDGTVTAMSQLNDLFNFNSKYVWAPWTCIYKIYTPREFKQCAIQQNIDSIKILGDSLAREHFQNLVMMVSNSDNMVLPKLLTSGGFSLPMSKDFSLNISFDHFSAVLQELVLQKTDLNRSENKSHSAGKAWILWNVPVLHHLFEGPHRDLSFDFGVRMKSIRNDSDYTRDGMVYLSDNTPVSGSSGYPHEDVNTSHTSHKSLINNTINEKKTTRNKNRSIFYEHPLIQREDPRVGREALLNSIPPPAPPVIPTIPLPHPQSTHPHSHLRPQYTNNSTPSDHSESFSPLFNHSKEHIRLQNISNNGSDSFIFNINYYQNDTSKWSSNNSTDDNFGGYIDTNYNDTNDAYDLPYTPPIQSMRVSDLSYMTPSRQKIQALKLKNMAIQAGETRLDGGLPTDARWESTWDGIHYSMISRMDQLKPNATCPGEYSRGGRDMCGTVKLLPGINKCENGYMYWCKHVVDKDAVFGSFEGGVSFMLTMMWINMMCND